MSKRTIRSKIVIYASKGAGWQDLFRVLLAGKTGPRVYLVVQNHLDKAAFQDWRERRYGQRPEFRNRARCIWVTPGNDLDLQANMFVFVSADDTLRKIQLSLDDAIRLARWSLTMLSKVFLVLPEVKGGWESVVRVHSTTPRFFCYYDPRKGQNPAQARDAIEAEL